MNWDTRGLPSVTYAIRVIASDAIGNCKRAEVSVNVGSPGGQDPDGDGHDNLMEPALGTPPLESNPGTVQQVVFRSVSARWLQLPAEKNTPPSWPGAVRVARFSAQRKRSAATPQFENDAFLSCF